MNGLINLFKPSGMSSAQAVSRVKRILGEKTVGHMGTLDPMAEGVLVIGVGRSARLFDYITNSGKTYIAKFKFGYSTDTLDALGSVTETTCDIPSSDAVLHAMQSLVGEIEQIPPAYSAKHVNGRRAYELARSGQSVELKPSRVTVYGVNMICQPRPDEMVFEIDCSSGTYIRAICRDVAAMCGSLATMTFLRRTRSGVFKVDDSITFESLEAKKSSVLISPEIALGGLERYDVADELWDDMLHGRKLASNLDGNARVYCRGVFFGIGHTVDGILKLKTYLKDD